MNEKSIKKYCREVKRHCPRSFGKKISSNLYNDILDYANGKDSISYEDICLRFGRPEAYAREYIASADNENIKYYSNKWRPLIITVVAAIAVALVVYIVAIAIALVDGLNSSGGYYEVSVNGERVCYEKID